MLEGWLNPQSKENLDGAAVSGPDAERRILGSWHCMTKGPGILSHCFSLPLALGPQVGSTAASTVPGLLKLMLSSGPWKSLYLRPLCAVQSCFLFGNRQLRVAMSRLNWVRWGWSLACWICFAFLEARPKMN